MIQQKMPPGQLFALAEDCAADYRLDEAIELFRRVAREAPDDAASLTRAGHLLLRRGRVDEAAVALGEAVTRDAGNATAWILKAEAAEQLGDWAMAVSAFREVTRLRAGLAIAHAKLGSALRRSGASAAAIPSLREATRLDISNPARHGDLAQALHDTRQMDEAVLVFRRQIILSPGAPGAEYNFAITLPLIGFREIGLSHMRRVVVIDPANGAAWSRISRFSVRLGSRQDFTLHDRRATILEPGDPEPLLRLAGRYRDDPTSITVRRRVLRVAPENLANLVSLADLLIDQGKAIEAMALLHAAVKGKGPAEAVIQAYRRASLDLGIPVPDWCRSGYRRWIEECESIQPTEMPRLAVQGPVISIVMPVCDPPVEVLADAIASVKQQSYQRWQLCIADDASTDPEIHRILDVATQDPRIVVARRTERGHISAASNTALTLASGEIVCFVDHDDMLAAHALSAVAAMFEKFPDAGLIYSDEDKIDLDGVRFDPHFKPDWNHDLLLSRNYICHLMSIRRLLVEAVGGFRIGLEGSQDHDLALRVIDTLQPEQIHHIPRVLYHWRTSPGSTALGLEVKPYVIQATRLVLQNYHDRRATQAEVQVTPKGWRTTWPLPSPPPLVSVIVPTRDRAGLLRRCLDGLIDGTDYASMEIIIVDNGSEEAEALELLDRVHETGTVRVIRAPGPFNFSRLNNLASESAHGAMFCFLNNDVEPMTPTWLTEMASHAARPEIGVVGAKLLYPDRRVQHGGIILCGQHVARHLHVGLDEESGGYWGRAEAVQTLAAVTGACMVMRREVFRTIDGFDEAFDVDFGDIDLCLRSGAAGFKTLWTPHAVMLHHESASRGNYFTPAKERRYEASRAGMVARWGKDLEHDPHYNPNLSIDPNEQPFELAFPPRGVA